MTKNPLMKYDRIKDVLIDIKNSHGSDVDINILRQEMAKNFNIIDHVALKRFLVSLDKLGLIQPSSLNRVKICL